MMSKSILNCENDRIKKLERFQLPNGFKKIGIGIAVCSFLSLFVNKFTINANEFRIVARYGMLIGMLLIAISREPIEDELISKLRMQSFSFAFIAGVFLALFQPFANYFVDTMVNPAEAYFKDSGDFVILWMLLSVKVFCFEILKRTHR